MDQLQHDPLTKQQIKERLHLLLYRPIEDHFKTRLDTLIMRNTLLGGYRHKSFVYKGVVYNCDIEPMPLRQNRLIPQLKAEMDKYLEDIRRLTNEEMPYVVGFINQALNSTNNVSDYLALFPDCVHEPIRELMRTCPCQQRGLSNEAVEKLQQRNAKGIDLLKQRLTLNLLL